jgi:3',5'-cyclic AMP phosphodiesterase CpdA
MRIYTDRLLPQARPLLSFGLVADVHYAPGTHNSRCYQDSLAKLQACVQALNARSLPAIVAMGDLIDSAETREAEQASLSELCAALGDFQGERHIVLGNHDLASFSKDEFLDVVRRACPIVERAATYGSFDRCGIHLVILDGNYRQDGTDFGRLNFRWEDAWLSAAQIEWLESDLAAASGRRTIIFCHENLVPPGGPLYDADDPHTLRNAPAVRAILEHSGNVWAVFQAHYHPGMCWTHNGIPYIGLRAMVEGAWPGHAAYAVASLYEDNTLSLEGFGQQASYTIAPDRA